MTANTKAPFEISLVQLGPDVWQPASAQGQGPWTQFWDMHSGGSAKLAPYEKIYIEAPQHEAKVIFYNRFGRSPNRVTCTCCGEDYSISEAPDLLQATGYQRNCDYAYFNKHGHEIPKEQAWLRGKGHHKDVVWHGWIERVSSDGYRTPHITLAEYITQPDVLVIYAENIKPEERVGVVPDEGYVWVG